MLKSINKLYLLFSIFLYFILFVKSSEKYILIYLISVLSFISYYIILYFNSKNNEKNFKRIYLSLEIFFYSFLFIFIYNILSYYYNSNFFVFSEADAIHYHKNTIELLSMPIGKAIEHYLSYMSFDDLGIILILYPLYHITESNLILNLFYLFGGIISSLSLFRLSKNFMSFKYAFLSSLSYSLSSFVLYYHSIGLKESVMVMLVVLSFDFYYKFVNNKNIITLLIALIFIGLLLFFRPAISAMIIGAIGIGSLFSRKGGVRVKIISLFIIIFLVSIGDTLLDIVNKYMAGGFELLMYARAADGMIIGGIPFTYAVNTLAQLIGPLPTVVSSEKIHLILYAPGLIYRVLLSFPFWLGVKYIYKSKSYILYPLVIFVLMEMSALIIIMEGLELRKSLPHLPFVFIIAFWFLDKYDNKIIVFKRPKRFQQLFKISMFILLIIIFYWNFK